jgi:hypothetical protein
MFNFPDLTLVKRTCSEIFEDEIKDFEDAENKSLDIDLPDTQINALAEQISALPDVYQEALIARLCLGFTTEEISKVFSISNPEKALVSAKVILNYSISQESNSRISMSSLKKACDKAFFAYVSQIKSETTRLSDDQSATKLKAFMRMQRKRKKTSGVAVLKYAAVFLIGIILCGTITLAVSAEIREKFFSWVISTYERYSSFEITTVAGNGSVITDISQLEIDLEYIPDGFELLNTTETATRKGIRYLDANEVRISITAALPDVSTDMNTEDVTIEDILVGEYEAKRWRKNDTEFIVWEQQGYMLSLITELDSETALKIAESVRLL